MLDGNLYSVIKKKHRVSEKQASRIVKNICKGVRALHEKDVLHRDLKL